MAYLNGKKLIFAPKVVIAGEAKANLIDMKIITENGCYEASSEGADGYSSVHVVVPGADTISNIASRQIDYLTLPTTTFIGQYAFASCSYLKTVDAPEVTGIGMAGFLACNGLKSVNFPKLVNISNASNQAYGVFANCVALEQIELPSVDLIGSFAFLRCTSLKKVVIGSPATIGANAFGSCSALDTLVIDTSKGMPVLSATSAFNGTKIGSNNGFIYTDNPEALKAEAVWINYAGIIKSKDELPTE